MKTLKNAKAIGVLNELTSVHCITWVGEDGVITYTYVTRRFVAKGEYEERNYGVVNPLRIFF